MSARKTVVLDGCGLHDQDLAPVLEELLGVLDREGSEVQTIPLRELKLAHCIGCFTCWLKTPGLCVENDAGREIAKAVIQSATTVLFTPVTFGGYSPDLKKMVDRFIPLISPFFAIDHDEIHHPPRYAQRPRFVIVGVQRRANIHEAQIFKTLAGRNAINLHTPSFAAEVVATTDGIQVLRHRFEGLLTRSDPLPFGRPAASLMPPVVAGIGGEASSPKRVLLVVGSPKTKSTSTSSILGAYVLERLGACGWETESLTLRPGLGRPDGEAELLAAVDRAGFILLVSPLYADALPYLVTKALAVIADHRQSVQNGSPKRLAAIVNSGFPETHQNAVALAICEEFAAQSRIDWRGGLALGGGGMIGGEPLDPGKRPRGGVKHVIEALDVTAAALSQDRPVPFEAVKLMAKNPVPFVPFAMWRWIYSRFGAKGFEQEAARNGVPRERLLQRRYAL